ncbi:MAG: hypothetical protein II535_04415 [Bacteroidales bacterium]|nr:hypothetical protein [Bacteroidales bacterium]
MNLTGFRLYRSTNVEAICMVGITAAILNRFSANFTKCPDVMCSRVVAASSSVETVIPSHRGTRRDISTMFCL